MKKADPVLVLLLLLWLIACQSKGAVVSDIQNPTSTVASIATPSRSPLATLPENPDETEIVQTSIAKVAQTMAVRATLRTPTAIRTRTSTVTLTPTFDFAGYQVTWRRFHSQTYSISFEYPSIYYYNETYAYYET